MAKNDLNILLKAIIDPKSSKEQIQQSINTLKKEAEQKPISLKINPQLDQTAIKRYQQSMDNALRNLKTSYGKTFETSPKIKTDLADLQKRLSQISVGMPKDMLKDTNLQFQTLSSNVKKVTMETKEAKGVMGAFFDDIGKNTAKLVSWTVLGGLIFGTGQKIKDAVQYIVEMDTALTDLSKVVNLTDEQLNMMKDTSIELGKELGKSSVDIMKGMAEFGRVTKDTKEIIELTRTASMMSNVTSLSANEAAKSLNTTMIAFGMNAKDSMKILDSFNEIQNNFRKLCGSKIFSN